VQSLGLRMTRSFIWAMNQHTWCYQKRIKTRVQIHSQLISYVSKYNNTQDLHILILLFGCNNIPFLLISYTRISLQKKIIIIGITLNVDFLPPQLLNVCIHYIFHLKTCKELSSLIYFLPENLQRTVFFKN